MRWKSHVRFGGRARETHQAERLAGRPGPTQPPGVVPGLAAIDSMRMTSRRT